MIVLTIVFLVLVALLVTTVYLLGFKLGGDHGQQELARVRLESAHAERQLHELTRGAFEAMAEQIEKRTGPR